MDRSVQRWLVAPVAAMAIAAPAGCSDGGGLPGQHPGPSRAAATAPKSGEPGAANPGNASFRSANLVVTASCTPGGPLRIEGWDPATWKRQAQATFTIPRTVVTSENRDASSALVDLCRTDEDDGVYDSDSIEWAVPRVRSLFDRDFTKMAVIIKDPASKGTRVGYLDRSGKLVDLTGPDSAFGNTPEEENAVMSPDGDRVWFTYRAAAGDKRIGYRMLSGDHALVDQGPVGTGLVALAVVGNPARAVQGEMVRLSPDGTRITGWAPDLRRANVVDLPATTGALTDATVQGPRVVNGCGEPIGWTDARTLLCAVERKAVDQIVTVDVETGVAGPDLLPPSDKEHEGMVISPDGRSVIIHSHRPFSQYSGFVGFSLVATTPGTAPQPLNLPGTDGRTLFLEWR